ncbi:MAG: GDSL-type esterase/lipase family protein, partial [Planctomycetota bacterium]
TTGHTATAEPSSAKPPTLVAFGDSITVGYGVNKGLGWVELLTDRLKKTGNTLAISNAGGNGNTSTQGMARMNTDVLTHMPGLVLVEFGGNDAAQHVTVDQFEKNLFTIAEKITSKGGSLVFLTFPPVIDEWHKVGKSPTFATWGGLDQCVEQYREKTRAVAKKLGARLCDIDVILRKLIKDNGKERYILKDGVHLTAESNTVVADAIVKFLTEKGKTTR